VLLHVPIVGRDAHQSEQRCATQLNVVAIGRGARQTHFAQLSPEARPNPALECRPIGVRYQVIADAIQPVGDRVRDRARCVAGECARNVKVDSHVVPAAAHHPPFIAKQAEAFDRVQCPG
jgi:hypothetical protein